MRSDWILLNNVALRISLFALRVSLARPVRPESAALQGAQGVGMEYRDSLFFDAMPRGRAKLRVG